MLSSSSTNNLVGRRVGPYVIKGLIAQGGMGAVYEAWHDRLQRQVALKTLLYGEKANSEDVQRFLNEARAAARLSHPNVVPVYDVGEAAGVRYLAMELVRGRTLYDRIKGEGPLEEDEAMDILARAADGLQHAHEVGILHRDLKPANILIQESDGTPRITDFGVAKAPENQRLTATGTALGTPNYMSPEQAMGMNESLDGRSDVWGLGAILYECLTGLPPYNESSEMETMQAVVNTPLVAPSIHRPGIDPDVEAIILKCLEKRREGRYPTAAEFAEDARRFLQGERVQARPMPETGLFMRGVKRNGLLGITLLVCIMVGVALALVLALPTLIEQRQGSKDLGAEASAFLTQRLEAAKTTLASDPSEASLRELFASLAWPKVEAAGIAALAAGGDEARTRAAQRALGTRADYEAQAAPLLAEIQLRIGGGGKGATQPEQVAALVEAGVLDPEGPAGRKARLALCRLLYRQHDRTSRRLAVQELEALAQAKQGTAAQALLARARADQLAWGQAALLAKAVRRSPDAEQVLTPEAHTRNGALADVAEDLRGKIVLPKQGQIAIGKDGQDPILVIAQRSVVRVYKLAKAAGGELPEPDRVWNLQPRVITHLALGDRSADGRDDMFLVTYQGGATEVGVIDAKVGSFQPLVRSGGSRVHGIATGDVDADGRADLAIAYWDLGRNSYVVLGSAGRTRAVPLYPQGKDDPRLVHQIARIAMADLDGDGRDEVVVGSSAKGDLRVDVRKLTPGQKVFQSRGSVPVGAISYLKTFRTLEGRGAVLAIVDYHEQHSLPDAAAERPAWFGRDGVYVVGDRDGKPQLLRRWTYGKDTPPTSSSLRATSGVNAACVRLGGKPWIARAARGAGGSPWTLELAPLDLLKLEGSVEATTRVVCLEPPAALHRLVAGDLDGDGNSELVVGRALFGLGRAATASPAPHPAASRPARLLWASRTLDALGRSKLASSYLGRLHEEHPESWAAHTAHGARVDALLDKAGAAGRRSRHSFRHYDLERGRTEWEVSRELYRKAAKLAEERAGAREWGKASYAWSRIGNRERAARALERGLTFPDQGPDRRSRLRAEMRALEQLRTLKTVAIDLRAEGDRRKLGVMKPLRTRYTPEGVSILCGPETSDAAMVSLDLGSTQPLVLEAELLLHGSAWSSNLQVGLFETNVTGNPSRLTGFQINMWSSSSRRAPIGRVSVGGRGVGPVFYLPSFHGAVRLRLELRAVTGGLEVEFRIYDDQRKLVFAARTQEPNSYLGATGRVFGLYAPMGRTPRTYSTEQPAWRMESWVTLRRLVLESAQPTVRARMGYPWSLHAMLAHGQARQALAGYNSLLGNAQYKKRYQRELLWHRGFARARLGDKRAHEDLVLALKTFPYHCVLSLENLAESLLDGDPRDRAVVARALQALARDKSGVMQLIARQLGGELNLAADPARVTHAGSRAAVFYLWMRRARAGRAGRWRYLTSYRRTVPNGRYPRTYYPRVLDLPLRKLDDGAFASLVKGTAGDKLERYRRLCRARAARPGASGPLVQLAQLYSGEGQLGLAEQALELAAEKSTEPIERRGILQQLAAILLSLKDRERLLTILGSLKQAGGLDQLGPEYGKLLGRDPRYRKLFGAK